MGRERVGGREYRRKFEKSLRGMQQGLSVLEKATMRGLPRGGGGGGGGRDQKSGIGEGEREGERAPAVRGWEVIRARWTRLQEKKCKSQDEQHAQAEELKAVPKRTCSMPATRRTRQQRT